MAEDQRRAAGRQGAAQRAERMVSAWGQRAFVEDNPDPYVRRTRHGEVSLVQVQGAVLPDGLKVVEVHAGGQVEGGDPHFVIVNPPTLVEDPAGDVEISGRRFREDPLAALAEVVGMHGGAMTGKRKRRTQG